MATNSDENVFMVALKTVPEDSTGVAHILEHTVLCGSEKYPVRDPFFMMLRRSLNTFMNAFTSSDWTAYPFATQNPKILTIYSRCISTPYSFLDLTLSISLKRVTG
jgi:Zn-dependent M16 (insulinase) family peptidase